MCWLSGTDDMAYRSASFFSKKKSTIECPVCMRRQEQHKHHTKVLFNKECKCRIKVPSQKRLSWQQWNSFLHLCLPFTFPQETQVAAFWLAVLLCPTENPWTYCEFNRAYLASVMAMPLQIKNQPGTVQMPLPFSEYWSHGIYRKKPHRPWETAPWSLL